MGGANVTRDYVARHVTQLVTNGTRGVVGFKSRGGDRKLQFSDRQLQTSDSKISIRKYERLNLNSDIACIENYLIFNLHKKITFQNALRYITLLCSAVQQSFLTLRVKLPFLLIFFLRKFFDQKSIFWHAKIWGAADPLPQHHWTVLISFSSSHVKHECTT